MVHFKHLGVSNQMINVSEVSDLTKFSVILIAKKVGIDSQRWLICLRL